MSDRLQHTIQLLNAGELAALEQFAAELLRHRRQASREPVRPWGYGWRGGLKDAPERSGVEAQATAVRMMADQLDTSRPR